MPTDTKKLKKRPRVGQVLPTECLDCGNPDGYKPIVVLREVEFRSDVFEIEYERLQCGKCGSAIMSDEQLVARIKKTVNAYQRKHGLLTAEELVARRKTLGFNSQQKLVEAAPELSEATLKRLEGGQHAQDKSTDRGIRAVLDELEEARMQRMVKWLMSDSAALTALTVSVELKSMPEWKWTSVTVPQLHYMGWSSSKVSKVKKSSNITISTEVVGNPRCPNPTEPLPIAV
jgi:hypothetical protein